MKRFFILMLILLCLLPDNAALAKPEDESKVIPNNLEQAYEYLNKTLSPDEKMKIKYVSTDDIITLHHSLGMWIRNNWLRPDNSPLFEILWNERCFNYYDDMSQFILTGYHYYLNGEEYTIEIYKQERQDEEKREIVAFTMFAIRLVGVLIIVGIMIYQIHMIIRCYRHKSHRIELLRRGNLVLARVEKLKRHGSRKNGFVIVNGEVKSGEVGGCTFSVSFTWNGEHYQEKLFESMNVSRYKRGDEIEILFLPEYPDEIITRGMKPYGIGKVIFSAIFYSIIDIILTLLLFAITFV